MMTRLSFLKNDDNACDSPSQLQGCDDEEAEDDQVEGHELEEDDLLRNELVELGVVRSCKM